MKNKDIMCFILILLVVAAIVYHYSQSRPKVVALHVSYVDHRQWNINYQTEHFDGHKVSVEGTSNSLNVSSGRNNVQENNA